MSVPKISWEEASRKEYPSSEHGTWRLAFRDGWLDASLGQRSTIATTAPDLNRRYGYLRGQAAYREECAREHEEKTQLEVR